MICSCVQGDTQVHERFPLEGVTLAVGLGSIGLQTLQAYMEGLLIGGTGGVEHKDQNPLRADDLVNCGSAAVGRYQSIEFTLVNVLLIGFVLGDLLCQNIQFLLGQLAQIQF